MKTKNSRQTGSAILTVLGIISIVVIVCGMLGFSASQQMRSSQITREMLKSRLIAESGLNKAYQAVKVDFSKAAGYEEKAEFGGGTYSVKSIPLKDGGTTRAQLVSEGVCGLGKTVVSVDLENRQRINFVGNGSDDYFNLLYDLLVGGTLDLKGNFNAEVTDIRANGDVTISGSALSDTKTVTSTGSITWKKSDGTVTMLTNQSPEEILSEALIAAINAFKEYAKANGAVYASGADIPQPVPGNVAYCTGSADGWSRTGDGCFIFEGPVSFQGDSLNISSVDGYPALIVLSAGDVKMNAGTEVHGAIIMPSSSLTLNGHSVFYGAILVGQGMTGNGTADLYSGDGQGFNLPPNSQTTDNVVITAWH